MTKEIDILKDHVPSPQEVAEYEQKWNTLADYVNQENALDKLFFNLCPENKDMSDILIKCSSLNDFYSTNIFKVHNVAKHFLNQKIDERLESCNGFGEHRDKRQKVLFLFFCDKVL